MLKNSKSSLPLSLSTFADLANKPVNLHRHLHDGVYIHGLLLQTALFHFLRVELCYMDMVMVQRKIKYISYLFTK